VAFGRPHTYVVSLMHCSRLWTWCAVSFTPRWMCPMLVIRWLVSVTSGIGINGDSVLSAVTTSYLPPTITALSSSVNGLKSMVREISCWQAVCVSSVLLRRRETLLLHALSVQGGDAVVLTGVNFGPMGSLEPVVQYGSSGRLFFAVNCTALAPSTSSAGGATQQLQCVSSPGVGANLTWTVTTSLQRSVPFFQPGSAAAGQSASRCDYGEPLLSYSS
jgi:hypothetical protein